MAKKKKTKKKASSRSNKTIIQTPRSTHGFSNADMIFLQRQLIINAALKDASEINFSLQLQQILQNSNPLFSSITESPKAWRIVPPGQSAKALDPTNTIGAGGRVNIGFAQVSSHFAMNAFGGIYCSKEKKTAIQEYLSSGPGSYEVVKLTHKSKKSVEMLDLDQLVASIDQLIPVASLAATVSQIPNNARWAMQKFPLASQILGEWMFKNKKSADGIRFSSTKSTGGINFFLFEPTDWQIT